MQCPLARVCHAICNVQTDRKSTVINLTALVCFSIEYLDLLPARAGAKNNKEGCRPQGYQPMKRTSNALKSNHFLKSWINS